MGVNWGLFFWIDGNEWWIFCIVKDYFYVINVDIGDFIIFFGENGKVSLYIGLGEEFVDFFIVVNILGIVYKDLII